MTNAACLAIIQFPLPTARLSSVLTNQTIDPNQPGQPKPFILLRPFIAAWHWLVPPTQAHRDRQSPLARWVARGTAAALGVTVVVLAFLYAKPMQDGYQHWKSDKLVNEARMLADDGKAAAAFYKAQEAMVIAPENVDAVRLNSEFLTVMKRPESLHLLDRIERLGATTPSDRQMRVQALVNLNRPKDASQLLEKILHNETPNSKLMKLAEDVWGKSQKDEMLIRSLRTYAEKHPEDREHSLRLAKIQAAAKQPGQIAEALHRAWDVAVGDDALSLLALEFLDSFETLPPDDARRLIERLRTHPKGNGWHQVAALQRQVLLYPSRRLLYIQEAVEQARGKTRDELWPLVRWLVEQGEHLQVLAIVSEEEVKNHQQLLENYLTSLTMLQRFTDLERLVNDKQVAKILNPSLSAFYRAHLAYVTHKSPEEVRSALIVAKAAAETDHRNELMMQIADYAEKRGHADIAEDAYKSVTVKSRMDRVGFQGLIRTTTVNGNTAGMLAAAAEAVRRWPDDPTYLESYLYANLLIGREIETSLIRVQKLLDIQPRDNTRRLMAALAYWQMKDMQAATNFLQDMDLRHLTAGQQAVFAAIARESGTDNAAQAARLVIGSIDPKATMLPEERNAFARAGR